MASELQSLLDKIQSEGVEKANEKANQIVEEAKKKAAQMVADAQKQCDEFRKKAEADAAVLQARSEQSIKQAARDVLLEVGQSIRQTFERVMRADVDAALSDDFMKTFLAQLVAAFAQAPGADKGIELLVSPAQAKELEAYAQAKFVRAVAGGVKIAPDRDVTAGVRVMVDNGRVEHDFTDAAIMDAMSKILRPSLATMIFGDDKKDDKQ